MAYNDLVHSDKINASTKVYMKRDNVGIIATLQPSKQIGGEERARRGRGEGEERAKRGRRENILSLNCRKWKRRQ